MAYVDGFIVPVPKKKVADYRKLARRTGKIWMEHGALFFQECLEDDVKPGKWTSFPRGVSAIAIASLAIADLARGGWHGLVEKGKSGGTTNVGFIHGGEATNVVTDRVTLKAEARSHDPKFRGQIIAAIEKAF